MVKSLNRTKIYKSSKVAVQSCPPDKYDLFGQTFNLCMLVLQCISVGWEKSYDLECYFMLVDTLSTKHLILMFRCVCHINYSLSFGYFSGCIDCHKRGNCSVSVGISLNNAVIQNECYMKRQCLKAITWSINPWQHSAGISLCCSFKSLHVNRCVPDILCPGRIRFLVILAYTNVLIYIWIGLQTSIVFISCLNCLFWGAPRCSPHPSNKKIKKYWWVITLSVAWLGVTM